MSKVAFWRTIGAAFAFVFGQPLRLLRIAGISLASVFLIDLAAHLWSPFSGMAVLALSRIIGGGMTALYVAIAVVLVLLYFALVFLSFAVAFHRAVLRGETRAWLALPRLRRRGWRFLGYSLLTTVLIGLPVLLTNSVATPILMASKPDAIVVIAWSLLLLYGTSLAVWTYGSSLMLVFPAIAEDEEGDLLGRTWQRGMGNRTRLFFGSILCALPFIAVGLITALVIFHYLPAGGEVARVRSLLTLRAVIDFAATFLEFAVLIAFYSFCHRQLAAPPAADAAAAQAAPAE